MAPLLLVWVLGCSGTDRPGPDREPGSDSPGDSPGDSAPPDPRVSLGDVYTCEAPLAEVAYTEVGAAWGLPAGPEDGDHLDGGGIAVDDLNGDGWLDLVLTYASQPLDVFYGGESGFSTARLGGRGGPPMWADLDGDGDRDLIVAGEASTLYWNEGGELREGGPLPRHAMGALRQPGVADLDGDGDLDLFVPASAPNTYDDLEDFILWNDGDGNLTQDLDALEDGKAHRKAFQALVLDWEGDHDPDLYVGNDMGREWGGNVLWENRGGAFVDASDACSCGLVQMGMGGDVGDFNQDGLPDIYLAATGVNTLLASAGQGIYVDVTSATGASPFEAELEMAWGAVWLDHDNDGQLDIAVAQGDLWAAHHPGQVQDRAINLMRLDDGRFEDVAPALGFTTEGSWRALVAADLNADGVQDLIVTDVVKRPYVYLSQGCTSKAWLVVEAPISSRVEVQAGGQTWVDWVSPQSGFGGAGPLEVWFGLGELDSVDRLTVTLPWSGEQVVYPGPFAARRRITVAASP